MNKDKTRYAIEVMQAFLDGAEIEVSEARDLDWRVDDDPEWEWLKCDYRIKKHRFWLVFCRGDKRSALRFDSRNDAEDMFRTTPKGLWELVEVQEIRE